MVSHQSVSLKFSFTIPGQPVGKERARKGPHGFYTPDRTKNYQTEAAWVAKRAGLSPREGPVALFIRAYVSAGKLHREGDPVTKRPDCDNIQKIVMDGLTGVAYFDDAQVYFCEVTKRYSKDPRVEVEVWYGDIS